MVNIKTFNSKTPARIGAEIYDKYRYNLSLYGQRLLLGLAKSLDLTYDIFPEWEIDITSLFKYLAIEDTGKRYDIVRDSFMEIMKNPLQYRVTDKRWGGYAWLTKVEFDKEKSNFVKIQFSDEVKPFLLNLRQYVELRPEHYLKLTSQYSTWVYPLLKNEVKLSKNHFKNQVVESEISIKRLREYTYTENNKSYDDKAEFLKKVIGIRRNQKQKEWEIMKECGALHEINESTDIYVRAEGVKSGRSYDRVKFWIRLKEDAAEERKTINKKTAKNSHLTQQTTQSGQQDVKLTSRIALSVLYNFARESKMTIQEYAMKAGYTINGEFAYKVENQQKAELLARKVKETQKK